jgi:hypothetical protein
MREPAREPVVAISAHHPLRRKTVSFEDIDLDQTATHAQANQPVAKEMKGAHSAGARRAAQW